MPTYSREVVSLSAFYSSKHQPSLDLWPVPYAYACTMLQTPIIVPARLGEIPPVPRRPRVLSGSWSKSTVSCILHNYLAKYLYTLLLRLLSYSKYCDIDSAERLLSDLNDSRCLGLHKVFHTRSHNGLISFLSFSYLQDPSASWTSLHDSRSFAFSQSSGALGIESLQCASPLRHPAFSAFGHPR